MLFLVVWTCYKPKFYLVNHFFSPPFFKVKKPSLMMNCGRWYWLTCGRYVEPWRHYGDNDECYFNINIKCRFQLSHQNWYSRFCNNKNCNLLHVSPITEKYFSVLNTVAEKSARSGIFSHSWYWLHKIHRDI